MEIISTERIDASSPLANAKHEAFCQNILAGMTQHAAYVAAGYKDNEGTAQNANKLTKNIPVATRIEYLKKAKADTAISGNITTMRAIWETGQRIVDEAIAAGKLDIANTALATQLNMLGLLNDPKYVRRHILGDDGSEQQHKDREDSPFIIELKKRQEEREKALRERKSK